MDMNSPSSLVDALTGLEALYVIPPRLHPDETVLVGNVFAAAQTCGIRRLVYHSVMHPASRDVPHHMRKAAAEELLRHSQLKWTILQPNTYAQNIFKRLRKRGEVVEVLSLWPLDAPGLAFVDLEDIAAAAALVCADTRYVYGTYELAGPQVLTPRELAQELSRAWLLAVEAHQVTREELPPASSDLRHLADHFAYHAHYAAHGFPGSSHALESILGDPATAIADVARRIGPPD